MKSLASVGLAQAHPNNNNDRYECIGHLKNSVVTIVTYFVYT